MAIKSADQISIVDVTDAYSVILTSEAHTFMGTDSAAKAGSTTTQIIAMLGSDQVSASVTVSEITKPTGVSVSSDGHATAPTLTISVTTAVTSGGVVKIPVHIGDITITKEFTFAIAFTGAKGDKGDSVTVRSTEVTYATSSNLTQPTSWVAEMPTASEGQYLWTKTVVTFTDGKSSTSYSYALQGKTGSQGTSVKVKNTVVTYGQSASPTSQPTSWSETIPTVPEGQYLWTKSVVTYTDNASVTTYTYAKQGAKGDKGDKGSAGADAITLTVTSSNGTIFKNSAIETVLTAHVYKAGVELNTTQIAALGTVKWYKDGNETAIATGATLTIDAGDVAHRATYLAQLEG